MGVVTLPLRVLDLAKPLFPAGRAAFTFWSKAPLPGSGPRSPIGDNIRHGAASSWAYRSSTAKLYEAVSEGRGDHRSERRPESRVAMPSFRTSRTVSHSADEMFDLVADVEKYPGFLPLCQGLDIRRRSTLPDGREVLVADMRVGFKAIRESFTSRVTLDRAAKGHHGRIYRRTVQVA